MADLELDIVSTADSRGLTQAVRDVDKLKGSSDALGKEFQDTADDSEALDKKITSLRQSIKALGAEFAKTQGPSVRKDLRADRSMLAELERIRKEMDSSSGGGIGVALGSAAGSRAGRGFSDGFLDAFESFGSMRLRHKLIAIAIGAGVVLAPALGAIIAGAVTGAAGLGGIAGGIATAGRDSRVKAAARDFSTAVGAEFFGSSAFVQPTIKALGILKQGFRELNLNEAFAPVAPLVDDVARGLVGLGKEFVPRFREALIAARPVIRQLAIELPRLGASLGTMFETIAKSPGALAGMKAGFNLLNNVIVGTGQFIDFLGRGFVKLIDIGIKVSGMLEDIGVLNPLPGVRWDKVNDDLEAFKAEMASTAAGVETFGGAMDPTQVELAQLADELDEASRSANALNVSLDELFGGQIDLQRATMDYEQAVDDLSQSIEDNGATLDIGSDKGRNNRRALLDVAEAAMRVRDAQQKVTGSVAGANIEYQKSIEKLITMAQKAGLSKKEIDKLVGNYQITFTIKTRGRVPRITPDLTYDIEGLIPSRRQHGGPVMADMPYVVGERGPELFIPSRSGGILSTAQTERLGSGRGNRAMRHEVVFSGDTDSAFAAAFQRMVRNGDITISSKAIQN